MSKYEKWITPRGTIHVRAQSALQYLCGNGHSSDHKKTTLRIDICAQCTIIKKKKELKEKRGW